jgi:integrase/recombinase XerD
VRSHQDRSALDTAIAAAPQPFRLIFTIIRETGLRANEVLQLNIEDVDLSAGREGLLIRGAKNRVERIQVLASTDMPKSIRGQRAWLRELGPREGHEPLFRSNRGTRLTYSAVYYQWGRLCTKATLLDGDGQPRYTVHQLRHTRGTQMVQDGHALHIVQRALGHKDPRSTQLYADVTEADVRRCHYKRRLVRSRV